MVLELVTHAIFNSISPVKFLSCVFLFTAVLAVRSYSKGYINVEDRDLHGQTFILIGCLSNEGLSLTQTLAMKGAQLILVDPEPTSPKIVQLVLLLREMTGNERIYVDECDLTSIESIKKFVETWNGNNRNGMVRDLETRIDSIVFANGGPMTPLISKYAFINFILPTLKKSLDASTKPIRIINLVDPIYSAAFPLPSEQLLAKSRLPSTLLHTARSALLELILLRQFHQRRKPASKSIKFISVCPGFTRHFVHSQFSRDRSGLIKSYLLSPFVWMFCKSSNEASQALLFAVMAKIASAIEVEDEKVPEDQEKKPEILDGEDRTEKGKEKVKVELKSGLLYREGKPIILPPLELSSDTVGEELWEQLESTTAQAVEQMVKEAKKTRATSEPKEGT